jgi:hypothetical protein
MKINGSEADAIKQKLHSCFAKNKECEITCLLEVEYLVHPEGLKDFSVSDIMIYKCARLL